MALTTVAQVRQLGGIDDEDAHLLFRLGSEPELNSFIEDHIEDSAEWIEARAPTAYAAAVAGTYQRTFAKAEAYFTLVDIFQPLEARKVVGSHWPLDSEESVNYTALIAEWKERLEEFTAAFFTTDTAENPVAFPVFSVGPVISRYTDDEIDSATQELWEIAELART